MQRTSTSASAIDGSNRTTCTTCTTGGAAAAATNVHDAAVCDHDSVSP